MWSSLSSAGFCNLKLYIHVPSVIFKPWITRYMIHVRTYTYIERVPRVYTVGGRGDKNFVTLNHENKHVRYMCTCNFFNNLFLH